MHSNDQSNGGISDPVTQADSLLGSTSGEAQEAYVVPNYVEDALRRIRTELQSAQPDAAREQWTKHEADLKKLLVAGAP
eukprot:SAG31_NODE_35317_length_324_cov_0.924444_1_plen_78_part_01